VRAVQKPQRLTGEHARLSAGDELAFAYANPEEYERLLVFVVDELQHVYWYHPAWSDATTNPTAIPIEATKRVVELREAVGHAFAGHKLTLYGVFGHEALTVKTVEERIARGTFPSPSGMRVVRYALEIEGP
jgi:hypothetical protein